MGKQLFNRRDRRGAGMVTDRPRIRTSAPTGTTAHFKAWMADLRAKSVLQRMKLDNLASQIEDGHTAGAFALLFVGGVRSVWDLSQLSADQVLAVRDVDIERADAVENYLRGRNVPLKWSVR